MLGAASTTQTDRDPISPFPPGFMLKSEEKKESPSQSSNTLKTLINRGDEE